MHTAFVIAALLLASPALAQPLPLPKPPGRQCPAGFASGAHWCTPMPGSTRDAVVKGQGACPSGWLQSGGFCLSPERRGR